MPVTSVGAIYATVSKLLQRVYIPHADDSEINQQFVGSGESILNVPIATYQQGGAPAVQAIIGAPAHNGRCAVVDPNSNAVIALITADPAIYSDPSGSTVIQHNQADVGDTWTGASFTRPFVEIAWQTGIIISVSPLDVSNPVPATAGNYLMKAVGPNAVNLRVGQIAPIAPFKIGVMPVGTVIL